MQKHTEINPMIKQIRRLQSPIKGRRALSWLLFLSLIAICLLLPAYHSAYPQKTADFFESHPQLRSIMVDVFDQSEGKMHMRPESITPQNNTLTKFTANTPQWQIDRTITPTYLGVDKLWSPSHALDRAHQALANDCKACHTTPFAQVQDKDCKACHKNAADHVDQKIITVKALKETSCTSCHSEHNGPDSLSQQNKMYTSSNCATCHSNIKKSFAKTKTENVKDFAKQHPEFRYQLAASTKPNDLVRTRHTKQGLIEKTDLKFPHDVHLKEGGVKSPKGKVDMNCTSCHTPNPDGLHFAPVTMKDHCQSCHDLKFEPAVSNREVPHGSVDLVLSTLREFYSYVQVNIVPVDENPLTAPINLVRPGKSEPKVASFVKSNGDSRSRAGAAASALFEKTTCNLCHEVKKINGAGKKGTPGRDLPQWTIGKITPAHPWLVSAEFDHSKHRLTDCTDCHAAKKSKKAEDVLMPSIATCKDCHTGKKAESNKLVSDCGLCHSFHQSAHKLVKESKQALKLSAKQ